MRKTKIFLFAIFLSIQSFAQINLEYTYSFGGLHIVNLANSGFKYYHYDDVNNQLIIYNLNHTIFKTINVPERPGYRAFGVANISETLFDSDNVIEFSYGEQKGVSQDVTSYVINENGTVLLTIPFCGDLSNVISAGVNGVKLIAHIVDTIVHTYTTKVYGLPGVMTTTMKKPNTYINNSTLSYPYPNPTNDFTIIDYQLPNGINNGEILLFDLHGNEINRYMVDRTFSHLKISINDLPSGNYYYCLKTIQGISESKKLITIK